MTKGGAAKGELVLAMFELANSFRHGWGVKKDAAAARQYYETAANLGDTDAMNEAGWCYLEGFGGKKDKVSHPRANLGKWQRARRKKEDVLRKPHLSCIRIMRRHISPTASLFGQRRAERLTVHCSSKRLSSLDWRKRREARRLATPGKHTFPFFSLARLFCFTPCPALPVQTEDCHASRDSTCIPSRYRQMTMTMTIDTLNGPREASSLHLRTPWSPQMIAMRHRNPPCGSCSVLPHLSRTRRAALRFPGGEGGGGRVSGSCNNSHFSNTCGFVTGTPERDPGRGGKQASACQGGRWCEDALALKASPPASHRTSMTGTLMVIFSFPFFSSLVSAAAPRAAEEARLGPHPGLCAWLPQLRHAATNPSQAAAEANPACLRKRSCSLAVHTRGSASVVSAHRHARLACTVPSPPGGWHHTLTRTHTDTHTHTHTPLPDHFTTALDRAMTGMFVRLGDQVRAHARYCP